MVVVVVVFGEGGGASRECAIFHSANVTSFSTFLIDPKTTTTTKTTTLTTYFQDDITQHHTTTTTTSTLPTSSYLLFSLSVSLFQVSWVESLSWKQTFSLFMLSQSSRHPRLIPSFFPSLSYMQVPLFTSSTGSLASLAEIARRSAAEVRFFHDAPPPAHSDAISCFFFSPTISDLLSAAPIATLEPSLPPPPTVRH